MMIWRGLPPAALASLMVVAAKQQRGGAVSCGAMAGHGIPAVMPEGGLSNMDGPNVDRPDIGGTAGVPPGRQ